VKNTNFESPFVGILEGKDPGDVIARDDEKRFAIITSLEPEAAVHWLVLPYESGYTTEEFEANEPDRFIDLIHYAINETKARVEEHPELRAGFTLKFHCGAYETIRHAKVHVLSVE
jgi:histidine triad (HIT) family protein